MKKTIVLATLLITGSGCSNQINSVEFNQSSSVYSTYINDIVSKIPQLSLDADNVQKILLNSKVLTESEKILLEETTIQIKTILSGLSRVARDAPVSRNPYELQRGIVTSSQLSMYIHVISNAANVVQTIVSNHINELAVEDIELLSKVNVQVTALLDSYNSLNESQTNNVTDVVKTVLQITMVILEIAKVVAVLAV